MESKVKILAVEFSVWKKLGLFNFLGNRRNLYRLIVHVDVACEFTLAMSSVRLLKQFKKKNPVSTPSGFEEEATSF